MNSFTGKATYFYDGKDVEFQYNSNPSLPLLMDIVDSIVSGVVSETSGFHPILRGYFTTVVLVDKLTDIQMPESFVESAEFIDQIGIFEIISSLVGSNTMEAIQSSVTQKIEFEKAMLLKKSPLDNLLETLNLVISKYGELFEGIDVNDVVSKMSKISEMTSIPEEKLVENILKFEEKKKANE